MHPSRLRRRPPPGRTRARPTTWTCARKRERPGCNPVFLNTGADCANQDLWHRSLPGLWTDSKPAMGVCAPGWSPRSIASTLVGRSAGDGLQPSHIRPARRARARSIDPPHGILSAEARCFCTWDRSRAVSHAALAAVLRLEEVSAGERLAAFSLASFANREHRAWPGTPVAATRAGLSRSQYLAARDGLARRGLVVVDEPGGGRGRSPVVWLGFAELGPWCDTEVNPGLVEAVLIQPRARDSAAAARDAGHRRRPRGRCHRTLRR